jgi:hypothetical protein
MNCDRESIYDQYDLPYYLMLPASLIFGGTSYVLLIFYTTRALLGIALWVAHALGLPTDIAML